MRLLVPLRPLRCTRSCVPVYAVTSTRCCVPSLLFPCSDRVSARLKCAGTPAPSEMYMILFAFRRLHGPVYTVTSTRCCAPGHMFPWSDQESASLKSMGCLRPLRCIWSCVPSDICVYAVLWTRPSVFPVLIESLRQLHASSTSLALLWDRPESAGVCCCVAPGTARDNSCGAFEEFWIF